MANSTKPKLLRSGLCVVRARIDNKIKKQGHCNNNGNRILARLAVSYVLAPPVGKSRKGRVVDQGLIAPSTKKQTCTQQQSLQNQVVVNVCATWPCVVATGSRTCDEWSTFALFGTGFVCPTVAVKISPGTGISRGTQQNRRRGRTSSRERPTKTCNAWSTFATHGSLSPPPPSTLQSFKGQQSCYALVAGKTRQACECGPQHVVRHEGR